MTGSWARAGARILPVIAWALAVAACGDSPTTDARGYTKAPLENPGAFITSEPSTAMDSLGTPIRPPVVDITLSDTTAAPAQGS